MDYKGLFEGQNGRKIKVFSLFLFLALVSWFLSNLSEPYETRTDVTLEYKSVPDSLLLGNDAVQIMETKIRTSGFRLLYFKLFKKNIVLDVSEVSFQNPNFYLTKSSVLKQMERQFSQQVSVLDLDRERLKVDLYQVERKKLAVRPQLNLQLEPNFLLEGQLKISPDSVIVKGPYAEIANLNELLTTEATLTEVSSDFALEAALIFPKGLSNSIFSHSRVEIEGKVVKFSEKVFEVPIRGINFPEGYTIKLIPEKVGVVCKASLERLRQISAGDFGITVDYQQLGGANNNTLLLQIAKQPEGVYGIRLQERTANFVMVRK